MNEKSGDEKDEVSTKHKWKKIRWTDSKKYVV